MAITLETVARQAGVSLMTASRALKDSPLVADKTKQRIVQLAEELGYVPNLVARSLAQKHSPIIGLIVTELSNPFFIPIVTAIQEVARTQNYFVIIADTQRRDTQQDSIVKQFQQLQISGLIITPISQNMHSLEALRDFGTPVVVIARRWENGDFVTADNMAGGKMVAEHLIGFRHQRLGCVFLDEAGHTAVIDRVTGFVSTVRDAGLSIPQNYMIKTISQRIEDGYQAADDFLEILPRPTAVFITADRIAVGFVDRLLSKGVRVPDDVAVVGYDDIRYSAFLKVPLTTVALPKQATGQIATEILLERLKQPGAGKTWRQVLLKPELIVRASCGSQAASKNGK